MALANPGVAIVAGITVAVAAMDIFRDEITDLFGTDLVGAGTGVSTIRRPLPTGTAR